MNQPYTKKPPQGVSLIEWESEHIIDRLMKLQPAPTHPELPVEERFLVDQSTLFGLPRCKQAASCASYRRQSAHTSSRAEAVRARRPRKANRGLALGKNRLHFGRNGDQVCNLVVEANFLICRCY
jgi:hypothetical protein